MTATKDLFLSTIKQTPLSTLKGDYLSGIVKHVKKFNYKKKQLIFREGFAPGGLFLIIRGKVKIFRTSESGKEIISFIARKYDMPGFHNMIGKSEYRSSAAAVENTDLFYIPGDVFNEMIVHSPALLNKLAIRLAADYDNLFDKLIDSTTKQVRKRVAEMLLRLKRKHGTEDDGVTLKIILSRQDMANLTFTNTETLVRTLSEFKKEGLVKLSGKKISIVKAGLLRKVSAKY